MARRKRPELAAEAHRLNLEQLARLGGEVRRSRRRQRRTQAGLAKAVGVVQSTISRLERGHGGSLSLDLWQRVFLTLGRRLIVDSPRDPGEEPGDAGHLAIQELVLRLGRAVGYRRTFELPSRPSDPVRSIDVGLRDDEHERFILVECWNTIGDIGAAARSTSRKLSEAAEVAIALGSKHHALVTGCWVVRATARNRALVARYPEVFAVRFPGSSAAWVRALTHGEGPPLEAGLVWCDVAATRLYPWRQRREGAFTARGRRLAQGQ
jgi:DNA-binding XRE family transcriptional regulator